MAWPRIAAWGIAALTAAAVCAGVAVVLVAGDTAGRVSIGVAALISTATLALGLLVARRRPRNAVAPLLCGMAMLVALSSLSDNYTPAQARRPDLLPEQSAVVAAIVMVAWAWMYVAISLLMLVFPDGKLLSRRWRWVAVGLVAVGLAFQLLIPLVPGRYDAPYESFEHPFGVLPTSVVLASRVVLITAMVVLAVTAAMSLWVRYRRGDEPRRRQLKWFALAGLLLPCTLVFGGIGKLLTGSYLLEAILQALLFIAIPVATTIAILRHDLYDVDRVLSATVRYGAITATLLAVFGLASFASGVLLARDSVAVAAGVTALSALLLAPLRTRLQRRVDRRLYPMRAAAMRAIDELRTQINTGQAHPEQLEDALRVALRDPTLQIGLAVPGSAGLVDKTGEPFDGATGRAQVTLEDRLIGVIATDGPASPQLLREVGSAAALLVEMIRLRLQVAAALREAESSRARLQHAGYQERRRLERDLHDGAQQRLVSLGLALRVAQRHLGDGTVDLDGLLDQSVAELGTAVAELRQLAHGLRPSCLDDGLRPALSELTGSVPLPVDLEITVDGTVPDDIATTAYFVASEAVANVVKHANAYRISLRAVLGADGQLRVRIDDDGRGGATAPPGSGLAGIADRVAAAGGSLTVRSPLGAGTTVEANLPCAS